MRPLLPINIIAGRAVRKKNETRTMTKCPTGVVFALSITMTAATIASLAKKQHYELSVWEFPRPSRSKVILEC